MLFLRVREAAVDKGVALVELAPRAGSLTRATPPPRCPTGRARRPAWPGPWPAPTTGRRRVDEDAWAAARAGADRAGAGGDGVVVVSAGPRWPRTGPWWRRPPPPWPRPGRRPASCPPCGGATYGRPRHGPGPGPPARAGRRSTRAGPGSRGAWGTVPAVADAMPPASCGALADGTMTAVVLWGPIRSATSPTRPGRRGPGQGRLRGGGGRLPVGLGRAGRRGAPRRHRPRAGGDDHQHRGTGQPAGPEAGGARTVLARLDDRLRDGRAAGRGLGCRERRRHLGRDRAAGPRARRHHPVRARRPGGPRRDRRPPGRLAGVRSGRRALEPFDPMATPASNRSSVQGAPPRSGAAEPPSAARERRTGPTRRRSPAAADARRPAAAAALAPARGRRPRLPRPTATRCGSSRAPLYDGGVAARRLRPARPPSSPPPACGPIPSTSRNLGVGAGGPVRVRSGRGEVVLEAVADDGCPAVWWPSTSTSTATEADRRPRPDRRRRGRGRRPAWRRRDGGPGRRGSRARRWATPSSPTAWAGPCCSSWSSRCWWPSPPCMVSVMLMIWFERKVISDMQARIGPNRAGPWGLLQTLADGTKLFFKEDLIPEQADRFVFKLAPYLASCPPSWPSPSSPVGGDVTVFGHTFELQVADPPVGILFLLAMSSVVGVRRHAGRLVVGVEVPAARIGAGLGPDDLLRGGPGHVGGHGGPDGRARCPPGASSTHRPHTFSPAGTSSGPASCPSSSS